MALVPGLGTFKTITSGSAPVTGAGALQDPRAPSNTAPPRVWRRNLNAHHEAIFPRNPDRGAMVPRNGEVQQLPNGDTGGVSRSPYFAGTFPGMRSRKIVRASMTNAKRGQLAVDMAYRLQTIANRRTKLVIEPGYSAKQFLTGLQPKPGRPAGTTSVFQPGKPAAVRGILYGLRTAPADVVRMFAARRAAASQQAQIAAGAPAYDAIQSSPVITSPAEVSAAKVQSAPSQTVDPVGAGSSNVLYLVAAVVVAVLFFRK